MQMKVRAIRACYLNDQLFSEGQEAVLDLPEDHPMLDHFEILSPKKRTKKASADPAQAGDPAGDQEQDDDQQPA